MSLNILPTCLSVPYICLMPMKARRGHPDSLETGITDGCEPPYRCWKLNLHALEKQSVLSSHWAISNSPRVIIWFMVLEVKSETDKIIPLQRQRTSKAELASGPTPVRMVSVYLQNKTLMMSSPFKSSFYDCLNDN